MTLYNLCNCVKAGGIIRYAGELVDSTQEDTTILTGAGGALALNSNSTVASAAAIAQAMRLDGETEIRMNAVMLPAYSVAVGGATGAQGSQGSQGAQGAQAP